MLGNNKMGPIGSHFKNRLVEIRVVVYEQSPRFRQLGRASSCPRYVSLRGRALRSLLQFDLHLSQQYASLRENATASQTSSQYSWWTIWSGLRTVRGQAVIEKDNANEVAVD